LADGTYEITAVYTDLAGNTSLPSEALVITVDNTDPAVPVFILDETSQAPSRYGDWHTLEGAIAIEGHTDPDVTVECTATGEVQNSDDTGFFRFENIDVALYENTFSVIASYSAGNVSFYRVSVTADEIRPPEV